MVCAIKAAAFATLDLRVPIVGAVFLAQETARPKEFARMVGAIAILVTKARTAACPNCVLATVLIAVFVIMDAVSVMLDTQVSIVPKWSLVRSTAPSEAFA